MSDQGPMHQPTPQHQRLQENAGKWNVACHYFMGPDQPPMEVQAVETVELLGGFWTVSLFESQMMGMPFKGRATMGYNPASGKWVSTWIDTMTPFLFQFEGDKADGGDEWRFSGKGPHPQTGEPVDYRTVERWNDDGSRTFEMFCVAPDAGEFQMFRYTYTRAD